MPVAAGGANVLSRSPWVIWTVWGDRLASHNSVSDIKATYAVCRQGFADVISCTACREGSQSLTQSITLD
jgi:hypothetical protein